MTGGKSQISVGPGCEYRHVMTHEIGHALGFFHEQSRTDRDSYVTIVWNNVPKSDNLFAFLFLESIITLKYSVSFEYLMKQTQRDN